MVSYPNWLLPEFENLDPMVGLVAVIVGGIGGFYQAKWMIDFNSISGGFTQGTLVLMMAVAGAIVTYNILHVISGRKWSGVDE